MARIRLNRFLAQCGVASRRNSEQLIGDGRVTVNGDVVRTPASRVDPEVDRIEVDGKAVQPPVDFFYFLLHKPAGYDVTRRDRFAPRVVYELLPDSAPDAVQAVGRLDRDTTGLLLLTNDGDLAFRLTHPRFEVEKEYLAFGELRPTKAQVAKLLRGVELEDGPAQADRAEPVSPEQARREGMNDVKTEGLRLVIRQGRKRIVRRLCAEVGYPLERLHRVRTGPLCLGDLREGKCRRLTAREVAALRRHVGLDEVTAG